MTHHNTKSDWFSPIESVSNLDLREFINVDAPMVVVRDPQLQRRDQHARAQLRSLPLFQVFDFNTVVHTDVWANRFQLVDYDHLASEGANADELTFPLLHVVTQEGIEEYAEEQLVRRLTERALEEGGTYVLVADTAAPKTPKYTKKPGKSIVDEFAEITPADYDHLSSVFLEKYLTSKIPVVDTRNVFFHSASTIHARQDAPADSIDALFDYTKAPSNSPVWEPARYFIESDLESVLENMSDRLREALRSWTERGDTQKVANNILEVLQVCDYDTEKLEAYRNQPARKR